MTAKTLEEALDQLERLDLAGLREAWRDIFGVKPTLRSRDLLRRMLAFELQARVSGGLSPELRQALRVASTSAPRKATLQPGAVITREWRGARYTVRVVEGGFEHLGIRYASLSEVARSITGARWSGPRFFGLLGVAKVAA